ncbi:MAG: hypothetical protein OEY14_01640 [Myxococcales bacterium]|nr:hypothetical protein [Myxococcales bacterium]
MGPFDVACRVAHAGGTMMRAYSSPERVMIFVATEASKVPEGALPFASVDGAVPGAAETWDHHQSGDRINLDAMPAEIDATRFRGVGTTLADTDAVVSVVALLEGGPGALEAQVRAVFESAATYCDHLAPHPGHDAATNARGERLHAWATGTMREAKGASEGFSQVCLELWRRVREGEPLPEAEPLHVAESAQVDRLIAEGRLQLHGELALVDLRGFPPLSPLAVYERHEARVAVILAEHRQGGRRYTVGTNPRRADAPSDLRPALLRLAAAEFAHGPPATNPEPGQENWGGRATVFGSPWNYGSRLEEAEVLKAIGEALEL